MEWTLCGYLIDKCGTVVLIVTPFDKYDKYSSGGYFQSKEDEKKNQNVRVSNPKTSAGKTT